MSHKAQIYGAQALAFTGFVIWNTKVAMLQRPDLWNSGVECGGDLASRHATNLFSGYFAPGCTEVTLNLEDIGPVKVLARSLDQLEKRIEWITGIKVLPMPTIKERRPLTKPQAAPVVPEPERLPNGDVHAGIVTREPGRSCSSCENFSAGQACTQQGASGIERPHPQVMRRCLGYAPLIENLDGRTGARLWPELKPTPAKEAVHG